MIRFRLFIDGGHVYLGGQPKERVVHGTEKQEMLFSGSNVLGQ